MGGTASSETQDSTRQVLIFVVFGAFPPGHLKCLNCLGVCRRCVDKALILNQKAICVRTKEKIKKKKKKEHDSGSQFRENLNVWRPECMHVQV